MSPSTYRAKSGPASRGSSLFYWFIGLIAAVLFGGLTAMLGHVTVITAQRPAPGQPFNVTLEGNVLDLFPLGSQEIPGVREVQVESGDERKGAKKSSLFKTYRLRFYDAQGPVKGMSFLYPGLAYYEALRDEINAQLNDPQATTFTLRRYDAGWWALVPAALLVLIPAGLILWSLRGSVGPVELWPDEEVLKTE